MSNFTFTFHFHALEKEMATHSSILAWRIPVTVETGGLPSMGSHRVGHDWSDLAAAAFTGRTEAEAPILCPPHVQSWLIGKDSDAGKDWGQEEKEVTGDAMVGWHYWLDGHEFEQTLGDSEGQGSLVFCCPWGCKESSMTHWPNNNNKQIQAGLWIFSHQRLDLQKKSRENSISLW